MALRVFPDERRLHAVDRAERKRKRVAKALATEAGKAMATRDKDHAIPLWRGRPPQVAGWFRGFNELAARTSYEHRNFITVPRLPLRLSLYRPFSSNAIPHCRYDGDLV